MEYRKHARKPLEIFWQKNMCLERIKNYMCKKVQQSGISYKKISKYTIDHAHALQNFEMVTRIDKI